MHGSHATVDAVCWCGERVAGPGRSTRLGGEVVGIVILGRTLGCSRMTKRHIDRFFGVVRDFEGEWVVTKRRRFEVELLPNRELLVGCASTSLNGGESGSLLERDF